MHVPTFIDRCTKAISEFQSVVNQVHKSSMMIEDVITGIRDTKLIQISDFESDGDGELFEVSELYERLESARVLRLEVLVRKYRSIEPLLIKIEEILAFSNTGKSPVLRNYYNYWEKKVFNAVTQMILVAIATFQAILNLDQALTPFAAATTAVAVGAVSENSPADEVGSMYKSAAAAAATAVLAHGPLCKIKVSMNGSTVVVTPALTEVYKYMSKVVVNVVESGKSFVRWLDGSCKEVRAIDWLVGWLVGWLVD
jgi:dynein heavy chain